MFPPPDPIAEGLARGWRVYGNDAHLQLPPTQRFDVVVIGTGAGGATTAEALAAAGLKVAMVEEGPLRSSRDFRQREADAYATLYQDAAARQTEDHGITILQGRCVGGSTTVNWTTSFRTPVPTLEHWQRVHGLVALTEERLAPWFDRAERRLGITPWATAPNRNNQLLADGAAALSMPTGVISRNVRGCWNLGSCGLGCPTNAKQSMLVTSLPAALDAGATLLVQHRVQRLHLRGARVVAVEATPVALDGSAHRARSIRLEAAHVVLAGGAINSPALLMRSQAPDPHGLLGRRTFLHPVVISAAVHEQPVQGWQGAPQSIYSDHHLTRHPIDGPIGFKLEVPPLHPLIFATTVPGFGRDHARLMAGFERTQAVLALMRDGFHPASRGGRVTVRRDGSPALDYPLDDLLGDAARRAWLAMAELQFASGALQVMPAHEDARPFSTWAEARSAIPHLPWRAGSARVVSAHVMGGCAMGPSAKHGVVAPDGRHWQIENLSIHDGSLFPTSIGANPQLSIYGLVGMLSAGLVRALTGRPTAA